MPNYRLQGPDPDFIVIRNRYSNCPFLKFLLHNNNVQMVLFVRLVGVVIGVDPR
jgi:hypothetical protein